MSNNKNFNESVTNEPIYFSERLKLPDIELYTIYDKKFSYPDDPKLDGAHIHDNYEIYVHISGDCSFLVDNAVYPLRRGDVILTRPGDVHFLILNEPSVIEYFCLWFTPSCGKVLLSFTDAEGFCSHLSFANDAGEKLIELFYGISTNDNSVDELEKTSLILQIILMLSKRKSESPHIAPSIPSEIQEIIDYINCEFGNIERVEDIAAHFNISAATLNRWFRRYIRISPQKFLKAKRLSYAKKLLDSGFTVTESCMRSGFSDCSYFISVFKKKFGETPHRYKRKSTDTY